MTWIAIRAMLGGVWGFLRSVPWPVYAFVAVVLAALWYGENRADAREAEVRAEYEATLAEANAANRAEEVRQAEEIASIAAQFEEEKSRAIEETRNTVLADLRSGKLRLRIPGCAARTSQAPASPGSSDGRADVWREDAYNLAVADSIAIADEADAHVKACQAVIRTYRGPQ